MSAPGVARNVGVGHADAGEHRDFQALHGLRFFVRLVIVTDEVEKAMDCKMRQVMLEGLALGLCFARAGLIGDHDVTQMMRPIRAVLLGRKRQHVGGLVVTTPMSVERADRLVVGEQDCKLAIARRRGGCRRQDGAAQHRLDAALGAPQRRLHHNVDGGRRIGPPASRRSHSLVSRARAVFRRAAWSYASTIRWTSSWRMTSSDVKTTCPMPSTPASSRVASASPEVWPGGRSTWLGSPVTIMRLFSPSRVRNIFICMVVVFCASSRMIAALVSVRPRMKASGAISISPVCSARSTTRASIRSYNAS